MRMIRSAAAFAAICCAAPALAAGFVDPAAIDVEVARFTSAGIGQPGGARLPVDRRMKLNPCPQPLSLEWHGKARQTVLVRCPAPGGWRLFVPVIAGETAAAPAVPIVARGESVAIAVRGRGFSLTRQGEALDQGAAGEWIRVRPAGAKTDPMRARVLRPGLVGMELP